MSLLVFLHCYYHSFVSLFGQLSQFVPLQSTEVCQRSGMFDPWKSNFRQTNRARRNLKAATSADVDLGAPALITAMSALGGKYAATVFVSAGLKAGAD